MRLIPTHSRRAFLQAGAAYVATSALGVAKADIATPALIDRFNLSALGKSLKGRLILPGDAGFVAASLPNNLRYSGIFPVAVAKCSGSHDVQSCIGWARNNGMPFAIRSGGHNYAGFSTTRGLLIDVKGMNAVNVDLREGVVKVQAGANNQMLRDALRTTNYAVPEGRCLSVGVRGLVLGGGGGFSATHAGLTCDSLLETELVSASAQRLTANAHGDAADLFWALRGGGGGNFGVNTAFTFKLTDVSLPVTVFNISWPGVKQVELIRALQKIQQQFPTQISMKISVYQSSPAAFPRMDQIEVNCLGQFFGRKTEALRALAAALTLSAPIAKNVQEVSYWHGPEVLSEPGVPAFFNSRSAYVRREISPEGLETMLRWTAKWPGGSVAQTGLGKLFAIGGRVQSVPPEGTAYVHRDKNFVFEIESVWDRADKPDTVARQNAWSKEYFLAMQPFLSRQSYVNFPNPELPDWARAYYGRNLERLTQIKRKYDPNNVFKYGQSIPLSPRTSAGRGLEVAAQ